MKITLTKNGAIIPYTIDGGYKCRGIILGTKSRNNENDRIVVVRQIYNEEDFIKNGQNELNSVEVEFKLNGMKCPGEIKTLVGFQEQYYN